MPILPSRLLRPKTVTLLVGTENALQAALAGALREQSGDIHYICRRVPHLLPAREPELSERVRVVRAGDAGALAYTVRRSRQSLVVIECDPGYLVNDRAVRTVADTCRDRACRGNAAVLLLAAGMDDMLRKLAIDRVLAVEEPHVRLQQLPLPGIRTG
ncbi:hypothetical protein FGU65_07040 [Methanoculleus sp. FWC-SCC1]|uniref:Uncharacterized protein n=1 Tax=Methanoculleus frigidifontis TaxID=2584085 RepID=A0ABT8M9P2_9EURY|nr:hypothetical protein [Methanoculleus sp. FWC-SCC1]MDN7024645.1 hypothetical protein [Methanoculleus sp. FWC-SCC1]